MYAQFAYTPWWSVTVESGEREFLPLEKGGQEGFDEEESFNPYNLPHPSFPKRGFKKEYLSFNRD
ncbi:MAG: hypothetical protein K8I29_12295 [Alphaproteobacteria bacterium]|uniref:Uncharacterized protein n=1 Tax=Candidatus Nitrobium versatile TaxID=2884831 RepID=A0A953M1N9_9BACT|nr:hypothetical protein [Candidatus Nitrobium versatile]